MRFEDKAEQRTYEHLCVELGKSLMEIKQLLERHTEWYQCFLSLSLSMTQTFSEDSSAPLS